MGSRFAQQAKVPITPPRRGRPSRAIDQLLHRDFLSPFVKRPLYVRFTDTREYLRCVAPGQDPITHAILFHMANVSFSERNEARSDSPVPAIAKAGRVLDAIA